MTPRGKLVVTLTLLVLLVGLGTADYLSQGNEYASVSNGGQSSSAGTPPPPGAVAKNTGPSVESIIEDQGLSAEEFDDLTLLAQVVTDGTEIQSSAVLHEGDRAGSVTWIETGTVKTHFITLKDALLTSFSPEMRDLRDETVTEAGTPVRNILSFVDPGLSEEKIVFVRVRERLFEFHIADGKEEVMQSFIDALTTR